MPVPVIPGPSLRRPAAAISWAARDSELRLLSSMKMICDSDSLRNGTGRGRGEPGRGPGPGSGRRTRQPLFKIKFKF